MGKMRKNLAIDQGMDELNEEVQTSLESSTDLFSSNFADEKSLGKNMDTRNLESLIHFKPDKMESAEEQLKSPEPVLNEKMHAFEEPLKDLVKKKAKMDRKTPKKKLVDESETDSKTHSVLDVEEKIPQKKKQVSDIFSRLKEKEKVSRAYVSAMSHKKMALSDQRIPMRITLQQSENLRVAQDRIVELDAEIERLRVENEELIATGDIFRERLDKVIMQNHHLKKIYEESREEFQEEKRTLMDTLGDQSREIEKMSIKNKELERRLSSNIKQIRVRERELENRLELMKLDNQTLAREKDQYILDLKRNIDRMKMDLDGHQDKHNETLRKIEKYRNQNRHVTRGLQTILNIARGNESSQTGENKGEEN